MSVPIYISQPPRAESRVEREWQWMRTEEGNQLSLGQGEGARPQRGHSYCLPLQSEFRLEQYDRRCLGLIHSTCPVIYYRDGKTTSSCSLTPQSCLSSSLFLDLVVQLFLLCCRMAYILPGNSLFALVSKSSFLYLESNRTIQTPKAGKTGRPLQPGSRWILWIGCGRARKPRA